MVGPLGWHGRKSCGGGWVSWSLISRHFTLSSTSSSALCAASVCAGGVNVGEGGVAEPRPVLLVGVAFDPFVDRMGLEVGARGADFLLILGDRRGGGADGDGPGKLDSASSSVSSTSAL